jgi:hypothetical protein
MEEARVRGENKAKHFFLMWKVFKHWRKRRFIDLCDIVFNFVK